MTEIIQAIFEAIRRRKQLESELILNRGGFPPLSARGCLQQLFPIEAGELRRTINGSLIYTGRSLAHKYRSIISCEDKAALALEGIWRGSDIRVGCIQRLWHKIAGREVILERDPIEESVYIRTARQEERVVREVQGRKVIFAEPMTEEAFISYRPWLDMRVVTFSYLTNEWGLKAGWRLELEEI